VRHFGNYDQALRAAKLDPEKVGAAAVPGQSSA